MQADLVLRSGASRELRFPLRADRVTLLGRGVFCHVILDHPDVAPTHCVLAPGRRQQSFQLIDGWTDTGTQVNGQAVGKTVVGVGDVVRIGPFELELVAASGEGAEAEEPTGGAARFELRPRAAGTGRALLRPCSIAVVGRHELADLRLDDAYVSDLHLLVTLSASDERATPLLLDLRSSNGTCVDGRPIHRTHVLPGGVVTVGRTTLSVVPVGAASHDGGAHPAAAGDAEAPATTELLFPDEPGSRLVRAAAGERGGAGSTSYEGFYGFDDLPFRLTADPDYLFRGGGHGQALGALLRWLRSPLPVGVVWGPAGSGKSLLVACLARELTYRRPVPVVVRPGLEDWTLDGLVAAASARARELHAELPTHGDTPLARWRAVVAELRRRNILVAVLVDDAEAAGRGFLDDLVALLESEAARVATRILLAGGEGLLERVACPPLEGLVGASCELRPLETNEVAAYIAHRLIRASGHRTLLFTRQAVELIAEHSRGIPRLINVVADAALFAACKAGQHRIGRDLVAQAIRAALEPPRPTEPD